MSWKTGLISCGSGMSAPLLSTGSHGITIGRRRIAGKTGTERSKGGGRAPIPLSIAGFMMFGLVSAVVVPTDIEEVVATVLQPGALDRCRICRASRSVSRSSAPVCTSKGEHHGVQSPGRPAADLHSSRPDGPDQRAGRPD